MGAEGGVAYYHAEAGLEGCDGAIGDVVDCLASVGCRIAQAVADGVDTLIGAVSGFEEEHGGPVVGEVFGELAGGAGRGFGDVVDIGVHSDVE